MFSLFLQITLLIASLFHFGLTLDAYDLDQAEISAYALEVELANELDDDQFEKYLVASYCAPSLDCSVFYDLPFASIYIYPNTTHHSIRAPPVS